ncbi:MAG TPA: TipAS antibiotic-recognition domain-containing protein [Candidatus Limnocylindria bacterium]|nr:TipAS antibiotic-recognition domain-containing protein [Candidatus Limnocylindria bacterium]
MDELQARINNRIAEEEERAQGRKTRAQREDTEHEQAGEQLRGMTREEHHGMGLLSEKLRAAMRVACESCNPRGEMAREAVLAQQEWLGRYWDSVEPGAHKGLVRMYAKDPRFAEYYDKIAPGCAAFMHDAVEYFYRDKAEG